MPEAPPAPEPARTLKQNLVRDVGPVFAVLFVALALWVGFTIVAPEDAEAADPVAPVAVYSAERDSAASTALAGARRSALEAALPLRAAVRDLAGFADAALLAEVGTAVAALDAALAGVEAAEVIDAASATHAAVPAFVERLAVDADARIAGATSADPVVLQTARETVGAVRLAAQNDRTGLAATFTPMRAAVESAVASHVQALARTTAESEADDWEAEPVPAPSGGCARSDLFCVKPLVVTALGAYVGTCPAGTMPHVFDVWANPGTITLDYPFDYVYSVMDGHNLAVEHCDPEGVPGAPHGPGPEPLPSPAPVPTTSW
ncbi:hypothetical protein [Agromyces aureus]|uniref:DUF5667 domain-containing protein n=1 Tax=Agromyces aureus TaxID=453304 RepID=A0A191WCR4_9MICO|nr:hypothetical protein [Agromyces aureus]ANJ25983.1 hypothetical protein ATC03_03775 [Agromyces aureus]